MATLDIRKEEYEIITDIKFDASNDRVILKKNNLVYYHYIRELEIHLCNFDDFDNFIKACYKAKELAGK